MMSVVISHLSFVAVGFVRRGFWNSCAHQHPADFHVFSTRLPSATSEMYLCDKGPMTNDK